MSRLTASAALLLCAVACGGCSLHVYRGLPGDRAQLAALSGEVERLRALRDQDQKDFELTRGQLETKLRDQQGVQVSMDERGLVVTIVSEFLFDSGKDELRAQGTPVLGSVAETIRATAADRQIGIEGHTDNEPIRVSGWKSNWELSTARAISVLHELERAGVDPAKMRATGYGEHHPVASNRSAEGRQKNRRVEIILLTKLSQSERRLLERS